MTGKDFTYLVEGDLCKLTEDIDTNGLTWHKGDILEVVYRSVHNPDELCVRDLDSKFGDRVYYKTLSSIWFLKCTEVYKKYKDRMNKLNSTTFTHKFNVGDTFWAMYCNKPKSYKVEKVNYYIDKNGPEVEYITTDNCNFYEDTSLYNTEEIYSTKDELLDSLR